MHICEQQGKPLGELRECAKQNTPNPREGSHIVICPMGHSITAEYLSNKCQFMRRKTRQRDARQCKRVNPDLAYVHASLNRLDKRTIESGVMRDDWATSDKFCK